MRAKPSTTSGYIAQRGAGLCERNQDLFSIIRITLIL